MLREHWRFSLERHTLSNGGNQEEGDEEDQRLGSYFAGFIEIWAHQDSTFWTANNVFLVVEALFFVALYQILGRSEWDSTIMFGLCAVGTAISISWIFVAGRWREAMLLMEHQARHLEKQLFADKLRALSGKHSSGKEDVGGEVEQLFPLYFWGSRAFFLSRKRIPERSQDEGELKVECELEYLIRRHHMDENPGAYPHRLASAFSSNAIVTTLLPVLFTLVWLVLLFVSSWLFAADLNESIDWANLRGLASQTIYDKAFIVGLLVPGIAVAVLFFILIWSKRRKSVRLQEFQKKIENLLEQSIGESKESEGTPPTAIEEGSRK